MCWMTRSSAATEDGHHREDFASVLTLFREVMKLAKSAASGDCHCSKSDKFSSGVAEQQKRILKVIQEFNELIDSESASAARVDRESEEHRPHKRVKRFHYDFRRRIAFPPGTKISVTPTFYLPFVRDLPDGLISNMSISFPFSSMWIILLRHVSLTSAWIDHNFIASGSGRTWADWRFKHFWNVFHFEAHLSTLLRPSKTTSQWLRRRAQVM